MEPVASPAQHSVPVRERVLETVRQQIIALTLAPGAAVSENDLSAALGVSRTPVRESLILLQGEGLVQVYPQRGTFVSLVDPQRVAQAQFIREAIECTALGELAQTAPPTEGIAALRENIAAQRKDGDDIEAFFRLDEAFHRGLLGLSGHADAWATVTSAKAHLDRARRLSLQDVRPIPIVIDQHEGILDAVAEQRIEDALTALRGHLRDVFDDIGRIQARKPHLFASSSAARVVRKTVSSLQ